jgi:class 3 adenylate cyclase/tetratricopeptide (TPR) repeat protein
VLTCAGCGTENEAGRKFCMECGQRLAEACPACGTVNAAGAKFCGECGTVLGGASDAAGVRGEPLAASAAGAGPRAASSATPAGAPVAERRLVSVLFIDLVGFTTLSESRDAEDTRDMLSGYFDTAREIVDRHGGVIEKFIGDAVMAVWGTPTAHEDDAERAVRTALQLVEAVGQIEVGGQRLEARAGVLTGEAAVTIGATGQGMVAGDLVNTASRLQSAAAPGTVLVGESTYRAALHAIAFESAGEHQLKGKELPVPAWRALAVVARRGGSGRAAQLEPPFVGRDEELRTLREQFHATAREGKPRLVTIVGQAGIGKSRLGWELEKYLDGVVENIFWHEGRSPSYGEGISYWALAEMVRGRAGIAESEDPETGRHRLGEMLEQFVPDATERRWIEPRLTGLLGLDELPTESREELFAAWRTFFERMAQQATVLLVFWDLQWADQGLLDFIEHLLTWARSSPIFVLAEARPELFERRPGWGATVRSSTSIHLEPLSDTDMRLLLAGLVPGLPEHALKAIVARAEGVPLYAVETLRMLIDRGVLEAEADGAQYALVGELPELAVPESLHALLAARLDALLPEERALITDAAVLGLSFSVDALRALGDIDPDAVAPRLDSLVKRELLVLDVEPRSPERGQYHFVQGVVREVAYQSLAKRERRTKHVAAARYFESLGEEELAGVLASHYLAAYRATPAGPEADALAAQARVTLRAAADRASALHSQSGALQYLEQALEVTADASERAALHERAATAATVAARTHEATAHARKAEEILASVGDRLGMLRMRTLDAWVKLSEHGDRAAIATLERALADVADMPPSPEIARAQAELGRAFMVAGRDEGLAWVDRAIGNSDLLSPGDLIEALVTRGTILLQLGRVDEAEVILRGAIAVADRSGNFLTALRARNNLQGVIEGTDLEESLAVVRESYEIARRYGHTTWVLQAIGVGLRVSFEAGKWDDWVDEARSEMPAEATFYRQWYEGSLAERLAYRGGADEAIGVLQRSLETDAVRESGQAQAGIASQMGDVLMTKQRWSEAIEATRAGWNHSDMARYATTTAMFAAVAAGDPGPLAEARKAFAAAVEGPRLPASVAGARIGDTLEALLEGRWEAARAAYVAAAKLLDGIGNRLLLSRLQLAVWHLAEGRFPEAADAGREAQAFFHDQGADAYVLGYRSHAATVPNVRVASPQGRAETRSPSARDA